MTGGSGLDRGAYVLGMHRSGTSVVAGIVDQLGLDGGPRASMLAADQFNSDGYWEQRPLIEWHDRVLASLHGWASAPPTPPTEHTRAATIDSFHDGPGQLVSQLFSMPWFLKDPRQCLLLWLWEATRGRDDLAIVAFRSPSAVADSLQRRNRYSQELGHALWERYCRDLLLGLAGRPCIILRYEDLVLEPTRWVGEVADALDANISRAEGRFGHQVTHAAALVRDLGHEPLTPASDPAHRDLQSVVDRLPGYHASFVTPDLPPASKRGPALIDRRRRRLNLLRPFARSSRTKGRIDRLPAVLRDLRRS